MTAKSFRDIIAWQKAKRLTVNIYEAFSDCRDFAYRDQIQRAAVSIMNNIAEGHSRSSNRAFINFLFIAKSSAAEVESMLELSIDLKHIDPKTAHDLIDNVDEIQKIISGFISKLATRDSSP